MKKSFLSLIPMLALVPTLAFAQAQSVAVSATVANYATTALTNGSLNLGSAIVQGTAATVAPSGASAAQVTVSFNTSSVDFQMPDQVVLTRVGFSETMLASLTCATATTTNAGTTAACGSAVSHVFTQTVSYNGVHQSKLATQTLYIGGTVAGDNTGTANARAGVYSGTITVTITNITT